MGYFDADTKAMLEVYCLEAGQLLEQLDKILQESQEQGYFTEEDVNGIFRIMHTIKSSSAMMGLTGLSSAAHRLEDIFSLLRNDVARREKPGSELFQLLFAFSDHVAADMDKMRADDYVPVDMTSVEEAIQSYLNVPEAETKKEQSGLEVPPIDGEGGVVYRVYFEKECKMENVRAYMLVNRLYQAGISCTCYPEHPEKTPGAAEYIHKNGFCLKVSEIDAGRAGGILKEGLFVASCEVVGKRVQVVKEEAPAVREYLKIRMDQLDNLQRLTGEMRILLSSLHMELKRCQNPDVEENVGHEMDILMESLEQTVVNMRMVRLESLVPKFRRILREVCRNEGKEAELVFTGTEVEADKNVVDFVSEAVTHILRNSLDHGIGTPKERQNLGKPPRGTITFESEVSGGELTIRISDDGRGMDLDKIRETARERGLFERPEEEYTDREILEMVTLPGFSTKEEVTEYSGRGVGLDVVKKKTEELGGHLYLNSHRGEGTSFRIRVPMTLAASECVRFFIGEYQFALPGRQVEHYFQAKEIQADGGGDGFVIYKKKKIPVINLRRLYHLAPEFPPGSALLYIRNQENEFCIPADTVIGQGKVVQQPLPPLLGRNFRHKTGILNFSIMGDGSICFHLDVESVLKYLRKGDRDESRKES